MWKPVFFNDTHTTLIKNESEQLWLIKSLTKNYSRNRFNVTLMSKKTIFLFFATFLLAKLYSLLRHISSYIVASIFFWHCQVAIHWGNQLFIFQIFLVRCFVIYVDSQINDFYQNWYDEQNNFLSRLYGIKNDWLY